MILVTNDGPAVVATTYWATPHAGRGLLYVTINAGAIRVLVPAPAAALLDELPPAGTPCRYEQGPDRCQIVLLDRPGDPYVVDVDARMADRRLPASDGGRAAPLHWYVPGAEPEAVRLARRETAVISVRVG